MRSLNRLFELHLIAKQNKTLRRPRHCDDVRQRYLSRLVNEKIVELALPIVPLKDPCGSGNYSLRKGCEGIAAARDVHEVRILIEKLAFALVTHLNADETSTAASDSVTARLE